MSRSRRTHLQIESLESKALLSAAPPPLHPASVAALVDGAVQGSTVVTELDVHTDFDGYLRCLGQLNGPGKDGFLDGRTLDGTVGLAPETGGVYTGTRWHFHLNSDGSYTLQCLGQLNGPGKDGFLDGRTLDGTVGLAPETGGVYTGTRWSLHHLGDGSYTLQCLGQLNGPGKDGFLDGRTLDGTVGLAPETGGVYTGTRWRISDSGIALSSAIPTSGLENVPAVPAVVTPDGGEASHPILQLGPWRCREKASRRFGAAQV